MNAETKENPSDVLEKGRLYQVTWKVGRVEMKSVGWYHSERSTSAEIEHIFRHTRQTVPMPVKDSLLNSFALQHRDIVKVESLRFYDPI